MANESVLSPEDDALHPVGIRRWRFQKLLFEAVQAAGMNIHFNKRLEGMKEIEEDELTLLRFSDGTTRTTKLLLAADGSRSRVRDLVSDGKCQLKYTGVTCLMGTATVARQERGICLPSSETTKCHGSFYPTGPTEQCFQFHFPTSLEEAQASLGTWGNLTEHVGQDECDKLAVRLRTDGWDEKYLEPLHHVDKAIKIGFATLEPHLECFVYGRVVLLGDAAHPPVPYLGQGAQQGLEDAGTFALLLKELCVIGEDKFSWIRLDTVLKLYNQLRVPRTSEMLDRGKLWGQMQQKRAENKKYNQVKEEKIKRDVFYHETLLAMLPGVKHDYKEELFKALEAEPLLPVPEEEAIC